MHATIKALLLKECKKHIKKYQRGIAIDLKNQKKFTKRTGIPSRPKATYIPRHWSLDNQFNPFYVRKNADCIAFTLAKKIKDETYSPKPCLIQSIPKPSGGSRNISIFTIPDAVVAKYLYSLLLKRNYPFFSSYSFAYRTDRNAHDAIQHLSNCVNGVPRLYILEYDFSKYFDTIEHKYLFEVIDKHLKTNSREKYLVNKFLKFEMADGFERYSNREFNCNSVGIPQGSTISLFLANVACMELDKKIESLGASFARFSDDNIIITTTYSDAHKCANIMIKHGDSSGTKINLAKSEGISLLTQDPNPEMRSKSYFDFLGHRISQESVGLRDKTIKRIKSKISQIIQKHLIHYPLKYGFSAKRFSASDKVDWDLVTCINEIRRYVYGKVTEEKINKVLSSKTEPLEFTISAMSFYPLVDDSQTFRKLDGWLVNSINGSLKKRQEILSRYIGYYERPTKEQLIKNNWYKCELKMETKLPSFYKSWIYTRKLVKIYGIQTFPAPEYY